MSNKFESAALIGDRVVILTTETVEVLSFNANGIIIAESMRRPATVQPEQVTRD